jgi:hypothetical protein
MNRLFFGDNLGRLRRTRELPAAAADLEHLDPSFNLTQAMHLSRHQPGGRRRWLCLALLINLAVVARAQEPLLTNSFPTNIFLTDENSLFFHSKGERVVRTQRIREAQKSNESRPAEQDPQGNWGKPVDGFQLSLRFEKQEFTNGEPVLATILMRNVSDKRQTYTTETIAGQPSPIHVFVWKEQAKLNLKTNDTLAPKVSVRSANLYPQTQHKYRLRLDDYYDLSKPGKYSVQAELSPRAPIGPAPVRAPGKEAMTSQKTTISIIRPPAR